MSMSPEPWLPEEPPDFYIASPDAGVPPDWLDEAPEWDDTAFEPPPISPAADFPLPDDFDLDPIPAIPEPIPQVQPSPDQREVERDTRWQLQASGILIEAHQSDHETSNYRVGMVEVWQDVDTGEQTGAYLHLADAPHLERAEEMQANIYQLADESGVSDHELGDFAHGLIKGRGTWQSLTEDQWAHLDHHPVPDTPDFTDDAIWDARDRLLAQTFETLEREEVDQPHEIEASIRGLGIQIEDFDPATTPPPLFDEATNTAYWVGVFQPDPNNPDEAITSLLTIRQDETGQPQAHLAPVATGTLDHAQHTAEYLLKVAERTDDAERLLDAAEGMAVATQHRELWQTEQGIALEDDHIPFHPLDLS